MTQQAHTVVTFTADMRWARVAIAVLKPLVYLRLISVDRAAYVASRLVRLRVA